MEAKNNGIAIGHALAGFNTPILANNIFFKEAISNLILQIECVICGSLVPTSPLVKMKVHFRKYFAFLSTSWAMFYSCYCFVLFLVAYKSGVSLSSASRLFCFTYKRFYELRTFRKKVADRLLRRIRETERQNAGLSGETAELSELTYDNLRELYLAVEQMREQIAQLKSQLDSLSQNANIPTQDIAQINVTTHRLATNV